jgi:hypothetical protein
MWNVKPKAIPVIIGAIGTVTKSSIKSLSNTPGSYSSRDHRKLPYCALYTYFGKC